MGEKYNFGILWWG